MGIILCSYFPVFLPQSLLLSRNESRMQHTLPDLSEVRARSQSLLTASSDEETMLTDRSHMLSAGGCRNNM